MPIDANIPLSVQTPQPVDPMAAYGRVLQLKNAMGQQQIQQAQLTGLGQENQMRATQMQQMQALNEAYKGSLNPDGTIDGGKLSSALAANGAGAKIPEVLKGVTEYQQSIATLGKTRLEVQNLQADAAGGLGRTLQTANYDPQLFLTKAQAAINAKAANPQDVAPQVQQVQQSLLKDPTGTEARLIVKGIADNAVANSEKWTALETARKAAEAQGTRADAIKQDADINQQKFITNETARLLGTAKDQHGWDNARIALGRQGVDLGNIPSTFSPKLAQSYSDQGKTPGQLTNEDLARLRIAQGDQRIVISQQNADANTERADRGPRAPNAANPYSPAAIDKQRKLLDAVHTQRDAIGSALAVQNGEQYVDPKTGKIAPTEMDDNIRATFQKQYQNVTNQGRSIIANYAANSNGRIRANELGDAPQQGQPQQGQQQKTPQAAGKNVAPEGTIITNPQTKQRLQKVNGQWKPL